MMIIRVWYGCEIYIGVFIIIVLLLWLLYINCLGIEYILRRNEIICSDVVKLNEN